MTASEIRKLVPGVRVEWAGIDRCAGVVTEATPDELQIQWDGDDRPTHYALEEGILMVQMGEHLSLEGGKPS